jgi:hypothetical protein
MGMGAMVLLASLMVLPGEAAAFGHHKIAAAAPTQQVVLEVCHPRTGCKLQVPVCVPLCCQGAPCVRFQHTLLGPGMTVFSWPCGYQVAVRYTHGGGYKVSAHG